MTRQTAAPFDHISLNPTYRAASGLADLVHSGALLLDPPYQRGSVWTLDQRIALVESWLRGLPAGVVILSDRGTETWRRANRGADPYETGKGIWAVIDGKQRLTTAVMLFSSEFAFPASWVPEDFVDVAEDTEDGPYVRYNTLTRKGQRFMENYCSLMVAETKDCSTEADEARLYLLVNGGGTQQTDADMANAARVAGA
ncbi:DUF262 domain-containing protein [Streptomyces sp. NPDC001781]